MELRIALTLEVRTLGRLGHKVVGSRMLRSTSTPPVSKTSKPNIAIYGLANPWRNVTSNAATLDRRWNKRSGITGYRASFASLRRKQAPITIPNTIRHITFTELQANITPPNSRPRSSVKVAPTMAMLPNQSTALSPSMRGVEGVSNCRNRASTTIANPEQGTLACQ